MKKPGFSPPVMKIFSDKKPGFSTGFSKCIFTVKNQELRFKIFLIFSLTLSEFLISKKGD
ncbi:Uncharacterized protein dnm_085440 [Desulfonema magnum]|uniref:Uncharacterized protein n=1 Tax=Desulfonema magnum TaxID=45655 RepID=A0A975BVF3_9BACT|nr:Uncharacterized protein dnm_085440 [Desulfonema magnum]